MGEAVGVGVIVGRFSVGVEVGVGTHAGPSHPEAALDLDRSTGEKSRVGLADRSGNFARSALGGTAAAIDRKTGDCGLRLRRWRHRRQKKDYWEKQREKSGRAHGFVPPRDTTGVSEGNQRTANENPV